MSPAKTSSKDGYLEHPAEAFVDFRGQGVPRVVCEEKHMGSRAVVIVCRDERAARERFRRRRGDWNRHHPDRATVLRRRGVGNGSARPGPRGPDGGPGFWEEHNTDWVVLDCELMPWSAKARELLKSQYAAGRFRRRRGAAGCARRTFSDWRPIGGRGVGGACGTGGGLLAARRCGPGGLSRRTRNYCWPVESIDDFKLAPFHILASENQVHIRQNHEWHMQTLAKVCAHDSRILLATPYRIVDVTSAEQVEEATSWWTELTERGGEGMVVKPLDFIAKGSKGLVQPAVKCRGREYLRIIYGPDYTSEANLARLRNRGLGRKLFTRLTRVCPRH